MDVPDGDQLLGFAVGATILLVILGAPVQVVRSVKRWLGDDEPPSTAPPEARAIVERMRLLIRPTLLMTPADGPRFSKLGGDPELPPGSAWPKGGARPRVFLGQIDFAELPVDAIDWLPKSGRIYAFLDPDDLDSASAVQVLQAGPGPGRHLAAPDGVARGREQRVDFAAYTMAPSLEWLGLDVGALDLRPSDFGDEFRNDPPSDAIAHRIGGYPDEIQDLCMPLACEHLARGWSLPAWGAPVSAEVEAAALEWRLLIQLDSDPKRGGEFCDGGRLYLFVRERDARAGDFSRTVTILQRY